jgi:hypothetical protein
MVDLLDRMICEALHRVAAVATGRGGYGRIAKGRIDGAVVLNEKTMRKK